MYRLRVFSCKSVSTIQCMYLAITRPKRTKKALVIHNTCDIIPNITKMSL